MKDEIRIGASRVELWAKKIHGERKAYGIASLREAAPTLNAQRRP